VRSADTIGPVSGVVPDLRELRGCGWSTVVGRLAECGWVRLPGALSQESVDALIASRRVDWHDLPEVEGHVHQQGQGAYQPLAECDDVVRRFASELVDQLSEAAAAGGWSAVPKFNEVTWTFYPEGTGHITPHRDPPAYGGVVAVCTLVGRASFSILDGEPPTQWFTAPGDVVVLCGHGWPRPDSLCPRHTVEPPERGDRMIMTLRSNRRGAGAPYL